MKIRRTVLDLWKAHRQTEEQINGTVLIGSPEGSESAVKEDDNKLKN
jgi:hypothetical protein